ncbi:MAG: hypothetical protein ACE5DI_02135 [Candidatus Micrarchaeia archaeon]
MADILITLIILVFFLTVIFFMFWIFHSFRKAAGHSLNHAEKKMEALKERYSKIEPQLEDLKNELSTKVGFDHVENTMHQLASAVASKSKKQIALQSIRANKKAPAKKK